MIIDLESSNNARVLSAVVGQMSDGMWENSSRVEAYWKNISIDGLTMKVNTDSYNSGFKGMSEQKIKDYFAKKIKAVVQEEVGNNKEGWKRENIEPSQYMHHIPVSICYQCYDWLKGRKGHIYGHDR